MNILKIYTIHDDKAGFFIQPFFAVTDGQATRMFIGSLGDSFPHRADFKLFTVGFFNTDTGDIEGAGPTLVLAGLSIPVSLDPRVKPAAPSAPAKKGKSQ